MPLRTLDALSRTIMSPVYPPGFVMRQSVTGAHKQQHATNRLIANCHRICSYPVTPHARHQFIAVRFVCSSMLRISLFSENLCLAFNLVRPDQTQTVTWEETFEILNQNCTVTGAARVRRVYNDRAAIRWILDVFPGD